VDAPSAKPGERPFVLLFVLLLLTVLAWPDLFVKGQVPVDGNVLRLSYPDWAFLHAHPPTFQQWPLWNPNRDMGEPFLADPQSLAAYPPVWLLCRLPSYLGYTRLWVLGHTLLAAWFMRKWMLRLGGDSVAALGSAFVIAFNGYFLAHGTLLNHFAAAAYCPIVFYFFYARRMLPLGAALALQWLAGFPPFSYLTVIALLVWSTFAGPARRAYLRLLWSGGAVALSLAAFQLIPFLELFTHSARPVLLNPAVATEFSEPAAQLLRMLVVPQWLAWRPQLIGDQAVVSFYVGPVVLLAAGWAVVKGPGRVRLLALAIGGCALLSLGSHLPGYAHASPLHVFRFPANWLLIATIGFALLSGFGIMQLTSARWKWIGALLILTDLLTFAQHGRTPWFDVSFLDEPPRLAQSLIPISSTSRIYHSPSVIHHLDERGSRNFSDWILFKDALVPSYGTAFGIREVSSYQVLKTARAARYQARLAAEGPSSPLVRWAGISTAMVLTPGEPPHIAVVSHDDSKPPLFFEAGTKSQHVTISAFRGGAIEGMVATEEPDTLVFSEVAYPGWEVHVDGQKGTLGVFEDTFMSVRVPAGQHRVRFDYVPLTFWIGTAISLGALVILVIRRIFGTN
jgi:hypothetical protein